jgi:anti-sigma factor RsiW
MEGRVVPTDCPDEGWLRAYMDRELPAEDQAVLARHVADCPTCQVTLRALAADAATVSDALAQVVVPAPATNAAWRRFVAGQPGLRPGPVGQPSGVPVVSGTRPSSVSYVSHLAHDAYRTVQYALRILLWRFDTMSRTSRVRWQPALAAVLLAVLLISVITVDPLRAAASQFLDIFRVRRLAVVQVQTGQLERLEQYQNRVFGKPQVDRAKPVDVPDAAAAGRQAGFAVLTPEFVPTGMTQEKITVEGAGQVKTQVNLQAARSVLQMANLPTDAIPADRDSLEVNAVLKPGVSLAYTNGTQSLVVIQAQSPEVDVPADVNLNRIGEVGLQLFGMSQEEAHRFSQSIDWSSTLVVPVPMNMASVQEVSLRGTTAYVITTTENAASPRRPRGPHTVVMWHENGLLYAVAGDFNRTMLMRVAESLH